LESLTRAKKVPDDLESLPVAEVEARLATGAGGLTQAEAERRLVTYGRNELAEKRTSEMVRFLAYFWGPIPWMIEGAIVLSAVVGHWTDFGIIVVLLLANALVGFWEEHQAGNAIAALKAKLAPRARVRRDGAWTGIDAACLVPGDVIRLRLGDIAPADVRLLDGGPVEVDQSALTGESLPVTREREAAL
jgi:H+-transporting ATPase